MEILTQGKGKRKNLNDKGEQGASGKMKYDWSKSI